MKWVVNIKETEGGASIEADNEGSFILDSDLVREVCCYGVVSRGENIAAASCQVVCTILSLHTESIWPQVWQNLLQWIPFIEVCVCVCSFVKISPCTELLLFRLEKRRDSWNTNQHILIDYIGNRRGAP